MDFRYKLSKITIGGKKLKKEKKKITNLYDVQDKVIKVFKDYSKKLILLYMIQNTEKESKY